jgi:hypothetical protein
MQNFRILIILLLCNIKLQGQIQIGTPNTQLTSKPVQTNVGTLKIICGADGELMIDGESKGNVEEGEIKKITVKAGALIIEIKPFDGRQSVREIVNVEASKEKAIELNVEGKAETKYNSSILIETTLSGNVKINGDLRGYVNAGSPSVFGVTPGINIIEIENPDGKYRIRETVESKSSTQGYKKFDLLNQKKQEEAAASRAENVRRAEEKRRAEEVHRAEEKKLAEEIRREEEKKKNELAKLEEEKKRAIEAIFFEKLRKLQDACKANNGYKIDVNGRTIIVAVADFPQKIDYKEALNACNSFGDGWRLPTKDESLAIYNQLFLKSIGNLKGSQYLISSESFEVFNFFGDKKFDDCIQCHVDGAVSIDWQFNMRAVKYLPDYNSSSKGFKINFADFECEVADGDFSEKMTWKQANDYCKKLGNGWRLPSIEELWAMETQLHRNSKGFFRSSYGNSVYWADQPDKRYDFYLGTGLYTINGDAQGFSHLRLIREIYNKKNEDKFNPKILNAKGLQIILKGKKLQVADLDFKEAMNWQEALEACKSLGNDWRLPTIKELEVIDKQLFDIAKSNFRKDNYWSSSVERKDVYISFTFYSHRRMYNKDNYKCYVRAVRDY